MKKFILWLKGVFCTHQFKTQHFYDRDTVKAVCIKCGRNYVVNEKYKWKFRLDDQAEKDYEELRRHIREFQENYFKSGGKPEE
jgi:hypothetical protein